jgi:hypothetical protein
MRVYVLFVSGAVAPQSMHWGCSTMSMFVVRLRHADWPQWPNKYLTTLSATGPVDGLAKVAART